MATGPPKPLAFTVVYTSSEDENYPASGLNRVHVSTASAASNRGWQTAKLCEYPQEIGFRFEGQVSISQLQILAHQSKTPTKVDVYIASYEGVGEPVPYHRSVFRKLGHLSFRNNEPTKYRSRERKTATVNEEGCYLKLVLHRCHLNQQNLYNQASILQVLVMGEVLQPFASTTERSSVTLPPIRRPAQQSMPTAPTPPREEDSVYHLVSPHGKTEASRDGDEGSPHHRGPPNPRRQLVVPQENTPPRRHDHVAFQDPPLRSGEAENELMNGLIRYRSQVMLDFERFYVALTNDLMAKKATAIDEEDFDLAKACKEQLAFLRRNAESIYALEATKVRAVFEEDFDAAKRAKLQMDKLVSHTRQVIAAANGSKTMRSSGDPDSLGSAPHRRRSINSETHVDIPVPEPRPPEPNAFDEQPVQSRYALKLAEEARRRQSAAQEAEAGDGPGEPSTSANVAASADDGQETENDAEGHSDAEEDADGSDARDATDDGDEGDDNNENPKHARTPRGVPDRAKGHGGGRTEPTESPDEAAPITAVAPSGLRFELETFEEWERDVYFAIQDEASRDGTAEPPAEPLTTTEGMTDFFSAFGHYATACLFSRRWKLRDAAIRVITQFLAVYFKHVITTNAINAMLKYLDQKGFGLLDPIQAVYLACCTFITRLVDGQIPDADLAAVQIHVQALLPRLFFRAADANTRAREEALTLIFLLANSAIGPERVAAAALADTVDHDKRRVPLQNHRALLSRLTVFQQLLAVHGLSKSVAVEPLMTRLLIPCLNHQNNEVRDLAIVVVGCVDSSKGQEIMRYLPQVRNPITRTVIEEKLAFPVDAGPPVEELTNTAESAASAQQQHKKRAVGASH